MENLKTSVQRWIAGRNKSGQTALVLIQRGIAHAFEHGDKTPLAYLASVNEASTAKNIRRVLMAFGLEVKADKKQPSGYRIINPEGWNPANYNRANDRLQQAIDEKLSIAGRKIGSAEFFMTDKERESAAKREAEKAAEAEAAPEAEAPEAPEAEAPEAEPSIEDTIARMTELFRAMDMGTQAVILANFRAIHNGEEETQEQVAA